MEPHKINLAIFLLFVFCGLIAGVLELVQLSWFPNHIQIQKDNYRWNFLMNIHAKIHKKTLVNWIHSSIHQNIIHYRQVDWIPEMQRWFNIWKSDNLIYHINNLNEKKYMISSLHAENPLIKSNTLSYYITWRDHA